MTHPFLAAIDQALVTHLPGGIRAGAEGVVIAEAFPESTRNPMLARRPTYRGVTVSRSMAPLVDGWLVETVEGFERP